MRPITKEWIDKAEGDWAVANREIRARKEPNYDAVCFHAQQCAEKYLKARLQEADIAFSKTHDLIKLIKVVLQVEPSWSLLESNLIPLTNFAVENSVSWKLRDESGSQECHSTQPNRTQSRPPSLWVKRLIHLPIQLEGSTSPALLKNNKVPL